MVPLFSMVKFVAIGIVCGFSGLNMGVAKDKKQGFCAFWEGKSTLLVRMTMFAKTKVFFPFGLDF